MSLFTRIALLLPILAGPALTAPYSALGDGEQFTYRVSWGIFSRAGEIKILSVKDTLDGKPVFHITVTTSTKGIVRGLYEYVSVAEAYIDAATGKILRATEVAHNGEKSTDALTVFDYSKRIAHHEDKVRPGRNREFDIPDGEAVDLLSALVQTRGWATEPGLKRDALIFAGRDFYPVTISVERTEKIRTRRGERETLVLIPRMTKEEPRGIFKRGGEIKVWISKEAEPLPVKMQLKLNIGTASLHLTDHRFAETASPAAKTE